jgi:hypothetical protein
VFHIVKKIKGMTWEEGEGKEGRNKTAEPCVLDI